MAQRTADQVVREAKTEAEAAVREAREEADRTLAEAKSKSRALVAEAEERARRAYEGAVADSRAEMEKAETSLHQVRQDVEALRGWVDLHKTHLLGILGEAQALVGSVGLLSEPPAVTWPASPADQGPSEEVTVPPAHSAPLPADAGPDVSGEHVALVPQAEEQQEARAARRATGTRATWRTGAARRRRPGPPTRPGPGPTRRHWPWRESASARPRAWYRSRRTMARPRRRRRRRRLLLTSVPWTASSASGTWVTTGPEQVPPPPVSGQGLFSPRCA